MQNYTLILPSSGLSCGVRWFETASRSVITQKTEEFSSTEAEAYDQKHYM